MDLDLDVRAKIVRLLKENLCHLQLDKDFFFLDMMQTEKELKIDFIKIKNFFS